MSELHFALVDEHQYQEKISNYQLSKYFRDWLTGDLKDLTLSLFRYFRYIKRIQNPNDFDIIMSLDQQRYLIASQTMNSLARLYEITPFSNLIIKIPSFPSRKVSVVDATRILTSKLQKTLEFTVSGAMTDIDYWKKQMYEFMSSDQMGICDDYELVHGDHITATHPPIITKPLQIPSGDLGEWCKKNQAELEEERKCTNLKLDLFSKQDILGKIHTIPISCTEGDLECLVAHHRLEYTIDEDDLSFRSQVNERPSVAYKELQKRWEKWCQDKLDERIGEVIAKYLPVHTVDGIVQIPNIDRNTVICVQHGYF